jgi:putative DNA primase/helicase
LERASRLVSHLQKCFGYSATGVTAEKVVFVAYGSGNNGKTTILTTISRLLGDYSGVVLIDSIMSRHESTNGLADLADLRGARFVQTSETEEGQRLAEGKLKRITQGVEGGKIKACRKYENPVEFIESHKLWIDCNHKPVVRGTDAAIWNRLHLIPFTITIAAEEIDRELPGKLMAEAEGILAWLVAGAVRWYQEGLSKPPEVAAAVQEYREEMDQVGRFIEECWIIGDSARAKGRDLFTKYRKWSDEAGEPSATETAFGRKLHERGYLKKHTDRGAVYDGIGLRPDENR